MFSEILHDGPYIPFGSGLPREPGTHLTGIIRYLQFKLGMLKTAPGWEMDVCADIGFLWETALSYAYRDRRVLGWDDPEFVVSGACGDIIRPDSYEIDGIHMSPDGIGPDPKEKYPLVDHEYKCTWRSSNKLPADDFYWDTQFKCYCRAMGVNVTVLHVMYLMGNYKGSGPQHKVYYIEYTEEELNAAWDMVVRNKEPYEKEKEASDAE